MLDLHRAAALEGRLILVGAQSLRTEPRAPTNGTGVHSTNLAGPKSRWDPAPHHACDRQPIPRRTLSVLHALSSRAFCAGLHTELCGGVEAGIAAAAVTEEIPHGLQSHVWEALQCGQHADAGMPWKTSCQPWPQKLVVTAKWLSARNAWDLLNLLG